MGFSATAQTDLDWRVAPIIDLVVSDELDQIVAALALRSLDIHQGQLDCLGAHCLHSFKNMCFCPLWA
jgi:hypothetical protein